VSGELIELVGAPREGVSDWQKTEVIKEMYTGKTLTRACDELKLERYEVDLARRDDPNFERALKEATRAVGDIQAEQVEDMYRELAQNQNITTTEKQTRLRIINGYAAHVRWMSDRTGSVYERKKAKDAVVETPGAFESNVPTAEDVE